MIVQERKSSVFIEPIEAAAEGCAPTVRIHVLAPGRKADVCEYVFTPAPSSIGGRAVRFDKLCMKRSSTSYVRYGIPPYGTMDCSCEGGQAHDVCGRPECRHMIATRKLIELGLLLAVKAKEVEPYGRFIGVKG